MRRLRFSIIPGLTLALTGAVAAAQNPTFTRDVLPILQQNCQVCHRAGGANLGGMIAPMAFTSYAEARPWAKSIAAEAAARRMPPWHAAPEFHGVFANERKLDEAQIATLVEWSNTGAARGNPADAPEPIDWPSHEGWSIGEPDLVVTMPEPYFVADDVEDLYISFRSPLTEAMLPEDRWIKAVEFRPGGPVVHHIIGTPLGGIAPGNDPIVYPEGIASRLRKGAEIEWQMHYHKEAGEGTGVWDQSSVAIKFYQPGEEIRHVMKGNPLGNFRFRIPPGDPAYTARAQFTLPEDARIVKLMPHMHLRGKAARFELTYPDGRSEAILDVPAYDFNWQTSYWFKEPPLAPAGTIVHATYTWDNSAENPANPDPGATVRWGQPTTAEMAFGWLSYIAAEPKPFKVPPLKK